ncbi:MAG: flagellar FlbD family protein [Treponema sp.]|jgi:flagellar protein FlbD|nr:flagellar FlbD family protein [Treponema sp.]MBO7613839.1 flagellar FlbD family protein [Treponema sp.]MBP5436401.1 flagellar FlbD family protein [Treponema sp.]MBP5576174.1 flagellar FlbD family protein [Treponema sp.]MBP5696392.1 flagellar FlbD family protein [Treponema sp.]
MIEVTRLNGKKYWINPHQIESMEQNPDLTLTLLSGKKVVVSDTPEEVVNKVVEYRRRIGIWNQEL